jgi:hypothetical protein
MKRIIKLSLGVVSLGVLMLTAHFFVLKPYIEDQDYRVSQTMDAFRQTQKANSGDSRNIERLEQLAHEGSGVSYVLLGKIYKIQAMKVSGIDMKAPNASFDQVDLTKFNALLVQSMRELRDSDLRYVLQSNAALFDDARKYNVLDDNQKVTPSLKNWLMYDVYSTLDPSTKEKLASCLNKLNEQFSGEVANFIHYQSRGTCSETPPNGSYVRAWKILFNASEVLTELNEVGDALTVSVASVNKS